MTDDVGAMKGRSIVLGSLAVIAAIATAITVIIVDRPDRVALIAVFRLGLTLALGWLVWRGRVWPRWLLGALVLYGAYGFLLGALRIGPTRPLGAAWLGTGVVYAASLAVLLAAQSSRSRSAAWTDAEREVQVPHTERP